MQILGSYIQPFDQISQYLHTVEGVFFQWAERHRTIIRIAYTQGNTSNINLQFYMVDLLEE